MLLLTLVIGVLTQRCASVIYHLNDSQYDRMPPLSALDDYGRCLRGGSIYCVAQLRLVAESRNELMDLIENYSAYSKKHFNHTVIDRGVCITETCKRDGSDDMGAVVEKYVNDTIFKEYGLQAKMSKLHYCDSSTSETDKDFLDWAVAAVFIGLVLMNVAGTIYDVLVGQNCETLSTGSRCLFSFSVIRNWKFLVSQPTSDDPHVESLKALYAIKTISVMITIVLHTLMVYGGAFTDDTHYYEKAFDNPFHFLIVNGLTIVQIFFVLSGFLLAYNLQIASESHDITWTMFPKIFLYRLCRLTPSYAIVLAFTATWFRHLGSGPLWNFHVSEAHSECRRLWWKHLLYIQNYEPGDRMSMCLVQAWSIAVDTQLFVLGLLAYMLTTPKTRYWGVATLLVGGFVAPALHVWLGDQDPMVLLVPESLRYFRNKTFAQFHIRAESNLTCYAIGLFLGYKISDWQRQSVDLSKYKFLRHMNFLAVILYALVFYSGRMFFEPEPVSMTVTVLYAVLLRLMLGLIVSYMLVSAVFKTEDALRWIAEWRGFVPLGRLSFMVYWLNMDVICFLSGQRTQLIQVSVFNMMMTYLAVTTFCFLVAVPYYLLVEAPMNRLVKVFVSYKKEKEQDKKIK